MRHAGTILFRTACVLSLFAMGCGQSEKPQQQAQSPKPEESGDKQPLKAQTVSRTTEAADTADAPMTMDLTPEFHEGSPEWTLREIADLRSDPIPTDPQEVARVRKERSRRIIELATKVIAETHKDAAQVDYFNAAVHELLEARLEMALRGHPDDIDALYDDVRHLDERDPTSAAAEEAAFTLARYAHTNARRFAAQQPRWLEEFSRQARVYADAYPARGDRAAPLLFAAGRSCELHAVRSTGDTARTLRNEATLCFTLLREQFADMPQGQRAVGILRRLSLVGRQLDEFSGPTLKGKQARIEALKGRPAIIAFWSSENAEFQESVETLRNTLRKYQSDRVYLVGVNLDREEADARSFIEKNQLPGSHIFFTGPDQQRWDNPIVKYWGILDIPTFWVLDSNGVVIQAAAQASDLDGALRRLRQ